MMELVHVFIIAGEIGDDGVQHIQFAYLERFFAE